MSSLSSTFIEFDIHALTGREIAGEEFQLKPDKIYWIHCDLNQIEQWKALTQKFSLPEEFISWCKEGEPIPRVLDTEQSMLLEIPTLLSDRLDENKAVIEGSLFLYLTHHFCLTASWHQQPSLINFKETYPKNLKFAQTPGFILFLILENVVNTYFSILREFEVVTDRIDLFVREKHKGSYNEVIGIRKQVTKIKHNIISLRELLVRISGHKTAVISEPCRVSLGELLNNVQMILNEMDAMREILNGTLDLIGNSLMQKMNQSVKILTGLSAIFIPLSVMFRIYELDLNWTPFLHSPYPYLFVFILCVAFYFLFIRRNQK